MEKVTLEAIMACIRQVSSACDSLAENFVVLSNRLDSANEAGVALRAMVGELNDRLNHEASELKSMQQTLRTELDAGLKSACVGFTDDIDAVRAGISAVQGQVADVRSSVEGVSKAVDELSAGVASNKDAIAAVAVVAEDHMKNHETALGAVSAAVREVETSLNDKLAVVQQGADNSAEELRSMVRGINDKVEQVPAAIAEVKTSLVAMVGEVEEKIIADNLRTAGNVETIRDQLASLDSSVSLRMSVNMAEHGARVGGQIAELTDTVDSRFAELSSSVKSFHESTAVNIAAMSDRIDSIEPTIGARFVGLADGINVRDENLSAVYRMGAERVEELSARVSELSSAVSQVGAAVSDAAAATTELAKRVDATATLAAEVSLKGMSVEEEIGKAIHEITERVESLESQETGVQIVTPKFDIAVSDAGLVVDLIGDDGSVVKSAAIPIDIGVRYVGVYSKDGTYHAGDMVTHDGSMWMSRGAVTGAPGKDVTGWRLVVKRGADGRSVRFFDKHEAGNLYAPGDLLNCNNRLWQSKAKNSSPPEAAQVASGDKWLLLSGVL